MEEAAVIFKKLMKEKRADSEMKKRNIIANILAILAGVLAVLFVIGKLAFRLSDYLAGLMDDKGESYAFKYGDIFYRKSGQGKPLLLVHDTGILSSGKEWRKIIPQLEKSHSVYCIDLPCHGSSYAEKMIYTNYIYARALCDFAKDIIGEKTDIICSNDASSIAVMAGRNEPELFDRMVFINPESFSHMTREKSMYERILSCLLMLPLIGTAIYVVFTSRPFISMKLRKDYFESPEKVDSHALDICSAASRTGGSAKRFSLASSMGHFTDMNIIFALRECSHKVYLIGGRSREEGRAILESYVHFLPEAESALSPGKDMPHLEFPQETVKIIEDFLCHG